LKCYADKSFLSPALEFSRRSIFIVVRADLKRQILKCVALTEARPPEKVFGVVPNIAASNESHLRIEIRLDVVVFKSNGYLVVLPPGLKPSRLVLASLSWSIALQQIRIEQQLLEKLKVRICAVYAVVMARNLRIAAGHNRAHPRISEQVPFNAADQKIIGRC